MSERKVLNKYYPPDFDPAKIPRMKLPKNRQYTVRLMAPFNMRCATCGEYIYKGKKFNARKEDVENEDYLGIRIYRFYIKCTRCLQEISFKTDPKNTDYEIEAGATRNFMALKLAEEQALREEQEAKEEEANNPMKLLENRTKQSKNEIELLESLEELKDLNRRQQVVDYETMLSAYDTTTSEREREERLQQLDEEYIKTIKFNSSQKRKLVIEEEIVEGIDSEPVQKASKSDETPVMTGRDNILPVTTNWSKTEINLKAKKAKFLSGLVKTKAKSETNASQSNSDKEILSNPVVPKTVSNLEILKTITTSKNVSSSESVATVANSGPIISTTNGLSLLGAYSDSESD